MNKLAIIVLILGVVVAGAVMLSTGRESKQAVVPSASNVSVMDGTQVVDIAVKGGYAPKVTSAKANMPTKLRMKTEGTFDCSSGVTIPSLGIRQILPSTGTTDIEIPAQKAGTTLAGVCSMGMYNFSVNFN